METIALAEVASVLAEPSRAAMCMALLDGRAWTVGELARSAGVAASTSSEHVARLRAAGFVVSVKQGRHSYVRIANPGIAELIEHLAQHAVRRPVAGLRSSLRVRNLEFARTCYDHLGGAVAVALRDGMLRAGLIDDTSGLALTPAGHKVLRDLGAEVALGNRRSLLRECLDWTERREHLAGAVPAAMLARGFDAGWLVRDQHRVVRVARSAVEPFALLGVDLRGHESAGALRG